MADKKSKHIKLTSHPGAGSAKPIPIHWGAADPQIRGPIIATLTTPEHRNVIGTHSGSYAVYRALAIAAKAFDPQHVPDLTNTAPTDPIGPYPAWHDPEKIVSIDPYGAVVADVFRDYLDKGYDVRPTIAVTQAHIDMPEIVDAIEHGRLTVDGKIVKSPREIAVTKAATEPVWYLPGVAKRFDCTESELRRTLFEQTGGMFPELVTRGDLDVFLPPIGGHTIAVRRSGQARRSSVTLTARVHDEWQRPTCSAPTSAPAGPTSLTRSRSASAAPRPAASASSCTSARRAARSARSPSSWSTTRASARPAATARRSTSRAPSASRASRTCGSRS
jgi:hypothetical protein